MAIFVKSLMWGETSCPFPPINIFFALSGFSGCDNPYDRIFFPEAVAYNNDSELLAHAHHQKPVFIIRMVGIGIPDGVLIIKHCFGFIECDSDLRYFFFFRR